MRTFCRVAVASTALIIAILALDDNRSSTAQDNDGFVSMFNGKDLTGWVNVNGAPGTFYVKDKQIITTGKPTGYLRTEKQYENFILEFEWMHVPVKPDAVGNSGLFVWGDPIPAVGTGYTRGIEVQVLVNLEWKDKKTGAVTASSHGDIFSIWGAKCLPDRPHPLGWERCMPNENRAKGANEWNHYRVEANDGVIKLAVNGKVVSGVSKCSPRKGYLALESEDSECRFRNIKIKELPSTNPKPEEIADVAQGHKALYSGLDLTGFEANDEVKKHWLPKGTVLHYDGKATGNAHMLATKKKFGDAEYIVDFRFPAKGATNCEFLFRSGASKSKLAVSLDAKQKSDAVNLKPAGEWNRLQVTVQRTAKGDAAMTAKLNGKALTVEGSYPDEGCPLVLRADGAMDFANLFVRELGKK